LRRFFTEGDTLPALKKKRLGAQGRDKKQQVVERKGGGRKFKLGMDVLGESGFGAK